MVYLYVLAGIDIFETEIKTWTQFYKTIPKLDVGDERTLLTEIQRIGNAMKRIRQSKNITTDYIAHKIGYEDKSTYCKIECGNVKHIDESKIRSFCKLMDCNIVYLYKLAGIDVFETKIKTWDEFYSMIPKLNDEEAKQIIELAKKISPPPLQNQ
jgi:transcriptional regulator with XRE-family HTH domain